jgi:hypothetical protein
MSRNEYGLDADYMKKRLQRMINDIDRFTPDEAFNELLRMALVASDQAGHEVDIRVKYNDSKKYLASRS